MSLLANFILIILAIAFVQYLRSDSKSCISSKRLRDIQQSRMVLQNSTLKERAQQNQRLVVIFGIDNAFTTSDPEWHKLFVNQSKDLLRAWDKDWTLLSTSVSDSVKQYLYLEKSEMPLLPLVQVLVFQTVMFKFFPETQLPSREDIEYITSRINSLWITSKLAKTNLADATTTRLELEAKLEYVFDTCRIQGRENPLNILLPAYETLWRVVLRTFLEIRFRSTSEYRYKYMVLFRTFFKNPSDKFQDHSEYQMSVAWIVKEGLRLYPPTRRIYRQIQDKVLAIDVEYLHRDEAVWGVDALLFLPSRWADLGDKLAYMPFGAGKFVCPAKPLAAPMLIGILVGTLLLEIDEKFKLTGNNAEDVLSFVPLENDRKSYKGLALLRGKSSLGR